MKEAHTSEIREEVVQPQEAVAEESGLAEHREGVEEKQTTVQTSFLIRSLKSEGGKGRINTAENLARERGIRKVSK